MSKQFFMTNEPFIKKYPHHEGTCGWGQHDNEVILIARNLCRSMVEYHDIW